MSSEGKIVEHWRVTDELDMMLQLGATGEPEGNPASREERNERP